MLTEMKIWLKVAIVSTLCMVLQNTQKHNYVNAEPQVPCFFIFGDSLSDAGNNNKLSTLAKVNYPPYGIDFPNGPTGRFCNGRTTVDILAMLLGFNRSIPAFASIDDQFFNTSEGVNYASGASGILGNTGRYLGDNISFGKQVMHHNILVSRLQENVGIQRTKRILNKCLYWVGLGSNDYINNYFSPQNYPASTRYTPDEFASLLIQRYRHHVMKLYKSGAKKVILVGLGRIGCIPHSLSSYQTNGSACVEYMNTAVQYFNVKLLSLVDELNGNLTNAKFIYINTYGMGSGDPTVLGFKVWDVGCCPVNEIGQCIPSTRPCANRKEYVFWDSFHPTEALNMITAARIYNAFDLSDSHPMDANQLVRFSSSDAVL